MTHEHAVLIHILTGSIGVFLYWGALLSRKGSARHKAWGRPFFITLLVVAVSVGPLLFLRTGAFNPAYVVQFSYLALCMLTVTGLAWTAIRWRHDPERFRGLHFKVLGPMLFVLGAVVLAAGLASGDPLPTVLSWVGLFHGVLMMRFAWRRAALLPSWWLNWHVTAVCSLFTAVHGTFFFVAWRWAVAPDADRDLAAGFHVGVLIVAAGLRLWYGARRGIPLRFTEAAPMSRMARV
jgi:hypothetical protein